MQEEFLNPEYTFTLWDGCLHQCSTFWCWFTITLIKATMNWRFQHHLTTKRCSISNVNHRSHRHPHGNYSPSWTMYFIKNHYLLFWIYILVSYKVLCIKNVSFLIYRKIDTINYLLISLLKARFKCDRFLLKMAWKMHCQ